MRLAVVAYEMEGAATGVGRYLEGLLAGLAELDPGWTLDLFFKGEPFEHPLWSDTHRPMRPHFDHRPDAHPIVWEQLRLPRLLRDAHREASFDAVFSPAYSLPPHLPAPGVVTIHDLSFERLPEEFSWKERWRRRLLARRAARQATRVLADTNAVAAEISDTYRVPHSKVGVVPIAVDVAPYSPTGIAPADDLARLEPYGITAPYLLFLGSALPRRRLDLAITAFAAAARERPDLRLVVAGQNRLPDPDQLQRWINSAGVSGRVLEPGWIDEADLPALYRQAELSFYLSTYEGYGLPPLESLAAGTPPIVGGGLALDDLWPEYPYRCAGLTPEEVVRQTLAAFADAPHRGEVGREGCERVARLTRRHCAELFVMEVRDALSL